MAREYGRPENFGMFRSLRAEGERHSSFALPMLPFLLCAVFGCLSVSAFERGGIAVAASAVLAAVLALSALTLKVFVFWRRKAPLRLPEALLCGAAFFGFFSYASHSATPNPYPDFTARAVDVLLRVDEVSRGANGSSYGVGEILSAPEGFPKLEGLSVWFSAGGGRKEKPAPELTRSQTVRFRGLLQPVRVAAKRSKWVSDNENKSREFERYLANRIIYYRLSAPSDSVEIVGRALGFYRFFADLHSRMEGWLDVFPFAFQEGSQPAATYCAMLLGDKSRLTKLQKESFAKTGTMHVFAISGLHVGFAAALLYFVCRALSLPRIMQPLVALPILFAYVEACGGRPSAMRAFMMVAAFWLALSLGRGMKAWGALLLSAAVALAVSPLYVFDAGFSLSYGVVASIFLYGLPLASFMKERFDRRYPIPNDWSSPLWKCYRTFAVWLFGAFSISLGAFFAGAPLSAYYFSYVSYGALLYSPVFVALAGGVVFCGFAAFLLPSAVGMWANCAAWFLIWAMSNSAETGNGLADMSVSFPLDNGFVCAASLFAFFGLSGALEFSRPAFRYVLPPLASASILLAWRAIG